MRKALLEKGKNQNLDGEALTNLKKDFELLLQDKHIQSFKLIDERKKNDIVLGNKRYSITSDTANPQTYLLQEKS